MSIEKIIGLCSKCGGTGIYGDPKDELGNPLPPVPCPYCSATGKEESKAVIDTTDIMAELSYIHGKVTAIWNQVKPG